MTLSEELMNHMHILLPFIGLWAFVFCSPIIQSLASLLTGEPWTSQDIENWLVEGCKWKLLKFYTCAWCQCFWTSALAACVYAELHGTWILLPAYVLSYSVITYYIACKIKK